MPKNTKQQFSEALDRLLERKSLDRITVSDITDECGLNRQTFYYHFHDIYELIEWQIDCQVAAIAGNENWLENFDELLDGLFLGMLESRRSVMHLYNSRGWHHIIDYMRRRLSPLLEARARYIVEKEGMMVDEGDIQFVVQIHEIAAYGVLDTWIDAGMPSSHPKDLDRLHRLTRGSLEHALSNFDRRGEKRDTEA